MYKINILFLLCIALLIYACNSSQDEGRAEQIRQEMEQQIVSLNSGDYFKDKAIRSFVRKDFESFTKTEITNLPG
jgi:hypothetical protein